MTLFFSIRTQTLLKHCLQLKLKVNLKFHMLNFSSNKNPNGIESTKIA